MFISKVSTHIGTACIGYCCSVGIELFSLGGSLNHLCDDKLTAKYTPAGPTTNFDPRAANSLDSGY